ncbi:MAG TPA: hypothetical protein VHU80_18155 [Polyangiaceae bacterium]|jgi:hypothetical protein|nr:hypothetical protein [Polyangiaceae bacterium]
MSKVRKNNEPRGYRSRAIGLTDILRVLPEKEIASLVDRLGIHVDPAKRIDVPSQVARALVATPELRDLTHFPGPTRELVHRIAEAKGVLLVASLPPALEPLAARGIAFARAVDEGVELILPIAFLLQLRSWEGEDPRGVRALLSQTSNEVGATIAAHYLGRPATPPVVLGLEAAWSALTDKARLAEELEALAPLERKLLQAVEDVGGEVDTEELLDLEREPMRLRGATGATPSRRGVGFALERRGFLVPIHPNRHVIPSEVSSIVSARRHQEREARRKEIRTFVLAEDHAPRRARFAQDPSVLALAMALAVREPNVEVRNGVGTPRSFVSKLAARFGRDPEAVALVAALSRATGLWDPSAAVPNSPPGSERVADLGDLLFRAWRRGGAWDEARPDGEMLRVGSEAREASVVSVVREMVLEALQELGEGRWVPWEAVAGFVRTDSRTPGINRLIERWAQRSGIEPMTVSEVAHRIAFESLHVLGVVDLGDVDDDGDGMGPTLRITPRGRAYLGEGAAPQPTEAPSRFLDTHALRVGPAARIAEVVAVAPFTEIGAVTGHLDLLVTPSGVARALGAGIEAELMRARLESLAPLPDPVHRLLAQASTVLGRAEFVTSQGFLWVDDPEVRELLRTRRQSADLFVDPSPPGGLLIVAGVDLDRLARRCRALGVEVLVDGDVYRTRSTAPPRRASVTPPPESGAAPRPSRIGTRRASTAPAAIKRNG